MVSTRPLLSITHPVRISAANTGSVMMSLTRAISKIPAAAPAVKECKYTARLSSFLPFRLEKPPNLGRKAIIRIVTTKTGWKANGNNSRSRHVPRRLVLLAGVAESVFLIQSTPIVSEEQKEEIREAMILDIKRSVLRIRESQYREAEELLHVALAYARKIADHQGEVYILDMLANIYFEEKRYDKAEQTFKEVLRRELASGKPENTDGIVEISAKLAKIYAERGDVDKAKIGFDFCLEHLEKKLKEVPEEKVEEMMTLFMKVLHWGSEFLLGAENKAEDSVHAATELIEKGLDRAKQLEQTGSEAYQTLANNLSTLYTWQNRAEDAIAVMQETIKLATASEHWSLAHFYLNLAHIYLENKDYENAASSANKAFDTAKKNKDKETMEEAKRLRTEVKEKRDAKG